MMDWNGVRDFLAVVEAGSLTAAAEELKVSQPTLSRRLSQLEDTLKVKLLVRTTRRLQVTEAGERILDQARRMAQEAGALEKAVAGADSSLEGTVRISTTEGLGITWLSGELAEFNRRYPGIRIELLIDNSMVNLLSRDADIALRLLRPTQQDLIARRVSLFRFGLYAARDYVEAHGLPQRAEDLLGEAGQHHRGVGLRGYTPTATWLQGLFGLERMVFLSNSLLAVRTAVLSGLGIGPVFRYLGDGDPRLQQVLTQEPAMEKEIWLTTLPELHSNARIRVTYDFLTRLLHRNQGLLAGITEGPTFGREDDDAQIG
ncbi:LysR family transcriptional regulator [Rhodovibrionaceae bacterium A322]